MRLATFLCAASVLACSAGRLPVEPSYVLPFAAGTAHAVLQGYRGPYGHTGALEFAYDFEMPIGAPVVAARAGTVVKVESRYSDGNRKAGEENYIFIAHGDGTFGRYYHLTKNAVLVGAGDRVRSGQTIGRSGDTGASAGPHLHFDVTRHCPEWGCQTIPVSFRNAAENPLQAGKVYRARRTIAGRD